MGSASSKIARLLVLAAAFSIPLGTKKFLHAYWGPPAEISSAFLYAADLLLIFAVCAFLFSGRRINTKGIFFYWGIIFLASLVSLAFSGDRWLSLYFLTELSLAALFGLLLASSLKGGLITLKALFSALFASALFQGAVGLFQFYKGRSLGIPFLGEAAPHEEMAKVVIAGSEYLRAYGTMPHANILAAFLGVGALSLFGIWLSRPHPQPFRDKLFFGAGFFALFMAIVATFSRSGWLALVAAFALAFAVLFVKRRAEFFTIVSPVVIAAAVVVISMNWAIAPRAHLSASEPSVDFRMRYNQMGITMLKKNPLGIGIGNTVPFAVSNDAYRAFGITKQADFQPIHNLYLLVAVELGIQGFLAFLALLGCVAFTVFKHAGSPTPEGSRTSVIVSTALLAYVLVFGLFDHFFWTLEAGRLMLFAVLGIVMGISSPRRSMDRTLASEAGN